MRPSFRAPPLRAAVRAGIALLVATLAASCRGSDAGREAGAPAARSAADAGDARVPLRPTAADSLPPSILGRGGPLGGLDVRYVPGDTATTGYLAVPEGEGPFPTVILIHEWNGLVDRVRRLADDLAAEGYVALAADLYRGRTGSSSEENRALASAAREDVEGMVANLDHAARFLRARDDVTGRVAAMGWCFGGGVALSYALGGERHEGTAIFYGSLVDDPERLASLSHPIYGTFGELDRGIPPEAVERFVAALREVGIENDVHVYDAVGHGFWLRVDEDPETRRAPALDAWQRLKSYLERTLRG